MNRAVSTVQSVNSGFLSWGDSDLRRPLKVQLGSQASSGVEAWNSAFLSSFQKGVRPPVLFKGGGGSCVFQEDQQGSQASQHVVRGSVVSHWSQCRGMRTYLELGGNSVSFLLVTGSTGFHLRVNK